VKIKKIMTVGIALLIAWFAFANTTLAAPPSCNWPPLDPQSWQKCLDDVASEAAQKAVAAYIAANAPAGTLPPPTAPVTGTLTYDRTNNKTLAQNQSSYIADYINQMIFAKGASALETDVIAAIQKTQVEAQTVGAEVHQGKRLELPSDRAWLVWCSNRNECTTRPSDVSDVLGSTINTQGRIYIQVVFDVNVVPRTLKVWESTGDLWAVALW